MKAFRVLTPLLAPRRNEWLGWLRIFSIHSRLMFPLLAVGLAALSIGVWWSVNSAVDADMRSRLEAKSDLVQATFQTRLDNYANSLIHLRGRTLVDGLPNEADFGRFMATLEVPRRFPGVRSIAFLRLEPAANGLGATSSITMVEPKDWQNTQALGYDPLSEPVRRQAILEAVKTGEPTLSAPLTLVSDKSQNAQAPGFMMYLPVYRGSVDRAPGPIDANQPLANVDGLVFAAFRASEFFEGAFGVPSLERETVNFRVAFFDPQNQPRALYNRFGSPMDPNGISRTFMLYGRKVELTVSPLAGFYSVSDRFLPSGVALGAAFISVLVLLTLKASQTQLLYETRAREMSYLAMQKSRNQTELLRRLNDFSRLVSSELDLDLLLNRLTDVVMKLGRGRAAFLYFGPQAGAPDPRFQLQVAQGIDAEMFLHRSITVNEALSIIPNRLIAKKADPDSDPLLSRLLSDVERYSDWIMIGIPSREFGRCGILFVGRIDGTRFEDAETEIIESLVTQAATAIENALLFRKVEDASRAKNAFLANMSHEIRTPLNAIVGFTDILVKDEVSGAQKAMLSRGIRKSSQQLTRIIDDILDLSKVEAGKLVIETKRLRLSTFLEELRSVVDLMVANKDVTFSIANSGPLPSHIETDEIRLKQVLVNLIGNAVKFTERGDVLLEIRHRNEPGGHALVFRIRDTGVGIAGDVRQRLFEPFSQGDDSKTRRFGGSGLGLALSRRLCQELGGDLELVESRVGEGSTFEARITVGALNGVRWADDLPLDAPDEAKTPRSPGQRLTGTRILLVEDSEDNQEIFRFFLEGAGARLEIVGNGLDAVRKAASEEFDLILMDIQIPEIDGKEATRRIRHQGFRKPIIALTAHAMQEERRSCIEAGCDGQITKPISGESLLYEVANYLRSRDGRNANSHPDRDASTLSGTASV